MCIPNHLAHRATAGRDCKNTLLQQAEASFCTPDHLAHAATIGTECRKTPLQSAIPFLCTPVPLAQALQEVCSVLLFAKKNNLTPKKR